MKHPYTLEFQLVGMGFALKGSRTVLTGFLNGYYKGSIQVLGAA